MLVCKMKLLNYNNLIATEYFNPCYLFSYHSESSSCKFDHDGATFTGNIVVRNTLFGYEHNINTLRPFFCDFYYGRRDQLLFQLASNTNSIIKFREKVFPIEEQFNMFGIFMNSKIKTTYKNNIDQFLVKFNQENKECSMWLE